jgi:hypothetical protein
MPTDQPMSPVTPKLLHETLEGRENEGVTPIPDLSRQATLDNWQRDIPPLTDAELIQLRIRVIALENLLVALLTEASERQLRIARDMAGYIAPRPGFTPHKLTLQAKSHIDDLIERAARFVSTNST